VIRIEGVRPLPGELRSISGGWGALHWFACIPMFLPLLVLPIVLVVIGDMDDASAVQARVLGVMFATVILWVLVQRMTPWVYSRAGKSAPTAGASYLWEISETGLEVGGALMASRIDWRAVKAVREEVDRFVFLLTPVNNPVLPKRQMTAGQITALKALIADVTASGRLGRGLK